MNEKQANISQSFENKILNLLKSKASGFRSSRALSEGLLGSGVGAGLGAANELRKDLSGEQGETSPEEKVNRYLHGALGGAATGAAFGGLKGAVKGKQMLADAARKEMSGMSPFIGEQLAKGVGEGKILSQLKNLKNMHVSEHLDEGSLAGKLQSLFSGSAPEQKGGLFSKAPKSFDDIVRETTEKEQMQAAKRLADQESTLARQARKEEETALKAQQKLEREKTRKGSLGGELASSEKEYTEALGKAEKNIRDPKTLQSLESAGKQRMNAVLGDKLFKEYQNALNSGDIARANQVMADLQKAMIVPPQEGLYSKIKNYLTKRPEQPVSDVQPVVKKTKAKTKKPKP